MGAAEVMDAPSFVRGIHSDSLEDRLLSSVVLINEGSDLESHWPQEYERLNKDLLIVSTSDQVDILENINDLTLRLNTYIKIISEGKLAGAVHVVERISGYTPEIKGVHVPQICDALYLAVKRGSKALSSVGYKALEDMPPLGVVFVTMAKLASDPPIDSAAGIQLEAQRYVISHTDQIAKEELKTPFIPAYAIIAAHGLPEQAEKAFAALREIPVPELKPTTEGHYEGDPLFNALTGILKNPGNSPTQQKALDLLFEKYGLWGLEAAALDGKPDIKITAITKISQVTSMAPYGRSFNPSTDDLERLKAGIYERLAGSFKNIPANGLVCFLKALRELTPPAMMIQTLWRVYKSNEKWMPAAHVINTIAQYIEFVQHVPNRDERNEIYYVISREHLNRDVRNAAKKQLPWFYFLKR